MMKVVERVYQVRCGGGDVRCEVMAYDKGNAAGKVVVSCNSLLRQVRLGIVVDTRL
jgi:hypothetical protein